MALYLRCLCVFISCWNLQFKPNEHAKAGSLFRKLLKLGLSLNILVTWISPCTGNPKWSDFSLWISCCQFQYFLEEYFRIWACECSCFWLTFIPKIENPAVLFFASICENYVSATDECSASTLSSNKTSTAKLWDSNNLQIMPPFELPLLFHAVETTDRVHDSV
jgi:hypothetical protein